MIVRKSQDAGELRERFLANREKVRTFTETWHCPEVRWPPFPEIPAPWVVLRQDEARWLDEDAPFMDEYHWLLQAEPHAEGLSQASAIWRFGAGHAFESLEIEFVSVPDPEYLSERLAAGADAAALKGWRSEDTGAVYDWLLEGLGSRPLGQMVRGQQRLGFVLLDIQRWPLPEGNDISATLTLKLTDRTLDGTPLDENGEPLTR